VGHPPAFELDGFLGAADSCIDSISAMLRKLSKKEKATNPSGDPFRNSLNQRRRWTTLVKNYRNECIHYCSIYMTGGYRIVVQGRKPIARVIPIRIPKEVPAADRATDRRPPSKLIGRRKRINVEILAHIHDTVGFVGIPPHTENAVLNGTTKQLADEMSELKRELQGMVPVEVFCARHLKKLYQFFSESIRGCAAHLQSV
jgi:hypothetical protein